MQCAITPSLGIMHNATLHKPTLSNNNNINKIQFVFVKDFFHFNAPKR